MTRINDKDYELEYHWIWELADNGWADWICPVCGRGMAPWVDYCPCQIDRNITWVSGTGTDNYANLDLKEFEKYATTNCEELKL